MKLIKEILITAICLCLTLPTLAEEVNFWTEGTLNYNGHPVTIHAIVNDTLPEQFLQIKLKGKKISKATLMEALSHHFTLAEGFGTGENYETVDDFYIRACAPKCNMLGAYMSKLIINRSIEEYYPVEAPDLSTVYEQCVAFLEELGYKAAENVGYVTHYSFEPDKNQGSGGDCIVALLPYEIAGLTTEYKSQIANRSSLQAKGKSGSHIMDYPWAEFTFNSDLHLVKMKMSTYEIASSSPLSGTPIPWQQAAKKVLEYIMLDEIDNIQTGLLKSAFGALMDDPDYSEEDFWEDYTVRITRVLPMWMPNWSNVCIPGWCIQCELYNEKTGRFYAPSYCVDIFTGELAAYQAK